MTPPARRLFLLLSLLVASALVPRTSAQEAAASIVGTWERVSVRDAKGEETLPGKPATRLILSADGHFLQTTVPTGSQPDADELKTRSKDELLARLNAITAGFGEWRVGGGLLVREARLGTRGQGWQTDRFSLEGDTLVLRDPVAGARTEERFRRVPPYVDAPPDPARVADLKTRLTRIRTIDPSDIDFADLQALKPLIGSAQVVMLGEQSHGDGATFDAKTRLIKFLHEQMGFDVLAFESGLYDCEVGDAILASGRPGQEALGSSIFGIWGSGERLVPLFDYLAATAKTGNRLVLTGFDPQFSMMDQPKLTAGFAKDLLAGLAAIDPSLADARARSLITAVAEALGKEYTPSREQRETTRLALAGLLARTKARAGSAPSRDADYILRLVGNLAAYEEEQWLLSQEGFKGLNGFNVRDARMAENLVWLLEHRYRGRKIIVWAASMHIAREAPAIDTQSPGFDYNGFRTLGQGAWEALQHRMYAVMFTAYDGTAGPPGGGWAITPARGDSLEGALHATEVPLGFVDFRSLPAGHWLRGSVPARPLGYGPMLAAWPRHFDALVYTETMYPNKRR